MAQCAWCASEVHTFWPETIQSPPGSRTARVAREARSLPAPGSLNSWHQMSSPVHSGRSQRPRWASLPNARMVGAAMPKPMTFLAGELSGAPAAANSLSATACRARGAPSPPSPGG